jgi:lipopolysaccharide heptosyltransferase I
VKILIIKLSSIGDVVQTLPALRALRQGHPDARIDWLVEEAASDIVKDHPLIDEAIVVKDRGWLKGVCGNLRTARYLARKKYDMVLDFQGLIKSGIWVFLSKGRRRIGFSNARELSHIFLNEKLPPYDPERHALCRYLDLARYAGGSPAPATEDGPIFPDPPIYIGEEEKERARMLLKEGGIPEGAPFFIINAGARWETKLWPEERFAELITRAKVTVEMKAVLVGSPSDEPRAGRINSMAGGAAINLSGRTSLKELAYLMSRARFVVTVDSGPMHIAAAVATRVVGLFGPTAPWRTGPYGKGHRVIREGLECSPCFQKKCDDLVCMGDISVDGVIGAILDQKELDGRVA